MKRVMIGVLVTICLANACAGEPVVLPSAAPDGTATAADSNPDDSPAADDNPAAPDNLAAPEDQESQAPATIAPDPESPEPSESELDEPTPVAPETTAPVPYVPAGQPGSAQDYADMIQRLEQLVPAELRAQAPWPDLRNPNPIVAQVEIFELWIWMAEFLTEPELVEIMAAPDSPSRDLVVTVFGELEAENVFERRTQQPYLAVDHVVVTFESAGLPLWLSRDVPDDAVVVYYTDSSGPVEVIDQDSGQIISLDSAIGSRAWLSIMVPTTVGWQLWRDQLLDPSDPELQVPDVPPPPGVVEDSPPPEV